VVAINIVPAGDERCDVCAGQRDRVKPAPGERWSASGTVGTICEDCRDDLYMDLDLGRRLDEREAPDDPNQN
jgi:hypothetical protein